MIHLILQHGYKKDQTSRSSLPSRLLIIFIPDFFQANHNFPISIAILELALLQYSTSHSSKTTKSSLILASKVYLLILTIFSNILSSKYLGKVRLFEDFPTTVPQNIAGVKCKKAIMASIFFGTDLFVVPAQTTNWDDIELRAMVIIFFY